MIRTSIAAVLALVVSLLVAVAAHSAGRPNATATVVRECGSIKGLDMPVVNVTTRNVDCRSARRWMVRELMRPLRFLDRVQVWWRRFGNHTQEYWKCRSLPLHSGRLAADVRCTARGSRVIHWQVADIGEDG
jgi:hypothetical protein